MSKPIIEVTGLSKKYQLGVVGATTLRDDLARLARRFRGGPPPEDPGQFWALRDVSFQVQPGEVVGVIGRNGAGKSTLLKILSRITEPTAGRAILRGRVASLLEVGTGFHQDLTGRENVFLNGAILGLRRAEIARRFDEIVAFAEVEKFIDTPVKHYSSGMRMRLAFAVAAHLDPDVLIVDEVLAVGDANFQDKCLGKMENVSRDQGRTVLFVSHNMPSLQRLCRSALLLQAGRLALQSHDVSDVIRRYLGDGGAASGSEWRNSGTNTFNNPYFKPTRFWVSAEQGGAATAHIPGDRELWLNVEGAVETFDAATSVGVAVIDERQEIVFWTFHNDCNGDRKRLHPGKAKFGVKIPSHFLNEGNYRVELMASLTFVRWLFGGPGDSCPAIEFKVTGGFILSPYWIAQRPGVVAPAFNWSYDRTDSVHS
ncbi:MAG TPA: ABC transporter ATP-binding protein [Opitutaceae bacterium]